MIPSLEVFFNLSLTGWRVYNLFCYIARGASILITSVQFAPANHIRRHISFGEHVMGLTLTQMLLFGKTTLIRNNKSCFVLWHQDFRIFLDSSKYTSAAMWLQHISLKVNHGPWVNSLIVNHPIHYTYWFFKVWCFSLLWDIILRLLKLTSICPL